MMELELCEGTQSWIYREYRRGLRNPHKDIPFVQVGDCSVQFNGDCFVRGSVRAVGELERRWEGGRR
jgi:hypothetical protein